jgi:hypothetical protein
MRDTRRMRSASLLVALAGAFAISSAGCGDDDPKKPDGGAGGPGGTSSGGTGGTSATTGGTGGSKAGSGGSPAAGSGGKGGSAAGTGGGAAGAGTGGKGGVGGAGTGGTAGSSGTGSPGSASVLERNNHPSRDGLFVQPGLTKAMVSKMASDASFKPSFSGNVWASPLYLENGPGGKGAFFLVTTKNDVFAFDETTGSTVWTKSIGSSPTDTGVPCGGIKPVGIISTPVIDGPSKTLFVAGAIGTNAIQRHELHALSTDDGSSRTGWPVDITKIKAGDLAFMPAPHNQRSALSLVNGIVYVAYGGHVGDCGAYHGWVVGVNASDPTKTGAWATRGQGEGIWAAGGLASDGKDVFAITGNRTGSGQTDQRTTDSEEVVRISGLGQFTLDNKNLFFPTHWRAMDSTDADFGATNPLYIEVQGATPSKYIVAFAKDGHMYLLDAANLGGANGSTPAVDFMVSNGNMSLRTVPAAYPGSSGMNVVITADSGGICPAGSTAGTGKKLMAIQIPPGSPPAPKVLWCAAQGSTSTAPIVTTTDGKSEPIVWFSKDGKLTALDGETGMVLWTSSDTCQGVTRWTSPIAVKGRIVVGANNQMCSWSVH